MLQIKKGYMPEQSWLRLPSVDTEEFSGSSTGIAQSPESKVQRPEAGNSILMMPVSCFPPCRRGFRRTEFLSKWGGEKKRKRNNQPYT